MKRLSSVIVLIVIIFHLDMPAVADSDPSPPVRLTVLGTCDFHGALEAHSSPVLGGRKVGGMDIIAAYVSALREANPGGVVLLDSGDLYQGTLLSAASEGRAVIEFYNRLGYQAAAVGNHEFDFGPVGEQNVARAAGDDPLGVVKLRIRQARFPFVASNIVDRKTRKAWRTPNLKPFTLIRRKGVTIGVVGLTTTETPETTLKSNVRGLEFRPLLSSLRRELPRIRAAGATVVIVLAHAGVRENPKTGEVEGPVADLARALKPGEVDLIIGGHAHRSFSGRINQIPVLQGWPNGISFTRADLSVDRVTGRVTDQVRLYDNTFFLRSNLDGTPLRYAGRIIRPVREFQDKLSELRRSIEHLRRRKLGRAGADLGLGSRMDSPVGNLITDAMRFADAEIDVAMYNSGGLRAPIPRGDITFGRIFEVMPFESNLIEISLTGNQIRQIIEHGLASEKGVMQVSGLSIVFDPEAPANRRCVDLKTHDGEDLDDDRTYVVAINDFLLGGGDGYYTFYQGGNVRSLTTTIRQAVLDYIRSKGTVRPGPGGRYIAEAGR